ncbi:MAG TPA: hypothetical protein VNY24_14750 [Candidatus Acidoferrales bacterium]|nr:hypothetical protein [Candidatus Acidoferrales bacterium]
MKENTLTKFSKDLLGAALAIVTIGIVSVPSVHAKSNSNKTSAQPENVVSHVEISGGPVTRMLLVKNKGKEYLLLGLSSSSGVALLDVTKPSEAHIIDMAAGAAGASATELKVVAGTLTLFGTSDAQSAASSEPREIRVLPGVTAFLKDKTHGLIYATNGDGLWIVKTPQRADADAQRDYYTFVESY